MKILPKYYTVILLIFTVLTSCKSKKETPISDFKSVKLQLTDNQLLDTIQKQTFDYFWEASDPNSGLARERVHMDNIYPTTPINTVTTGGSGFGLMAILVGVERQWITREQALDRYLKAITFLETADRFHGAKW